MKRVDIFSKKYYTDYHDVDEDAMTIVRLCGNHPGVSPWTGITHRLLMDGLTIVYDSVASRKNKNSLSRY